MISSIRAFKPSWAIATGDDAHSERNREYLDPERRDAEIDVPSGQEIEAFQHRDERGHPTVIAGSRMCQPITQANCSRDRNTGSKSITRLSRCRAGENHFICCSSRHRDHASIQSRDQAIEIGVGVDTAKIWPKFRPALRKPFLSLYVGERDDDRLTRLPLFTEAVQARLRPTPGARPGCLLTRQLCC